MQLPEEDEEARAEKEREQHDRETYIREAEEAFGHGVNVVGGRDGSTMPRDMSVSM